MIILEKACNEFVEKCYDLISYKSTSVIVERAQEPYQILWENLHMTTTIIVTYSILGWALVALVVGASYGCTYGLKTNDNEGSMGIVKNILTSVMIIIFNKLLGFVMYYSKPGHYSRVHQSEVYTLKVAIVFLKMLYKIREYF